MANIFWGKLNEIWPVTYATMYLNNSKRMQKSRNQPPVNITGIGYNTSLRYWVLRLSNILYMNYLSPKANSQRRLRINLFIFRNNLAHLFQCVIIWLMEITHCCMNTFAQSCQKQLSNKRKSMFKSCCSCIQVFNCNVHNRSLDLFAWKRCGIVILHEAMKSKIFASSHHFI